ncbi:MAG: cysteine desulfurase family protein [Halieaceae bacterium]|nr:cysteine desulfurase family protein [Halieaceae bacterium]
MIYFDSAASYPVLPEVQTRLKLTVNTLFGNPSAQHSAGEMAANLVEQARETIADAIGALPSEIIFTSGATESNNLAIKGHFSRPEYAQKRHMVISAIEHKCIHAIADYLMRTQNIAVTVVKPNTSGIIDTGAIREALREDTSLVSIMHVNNELGTINPIKSIGDLCLQHGVRFHTDAAQSFLKTDIDVDEFNLDYISLSGHKIGAMKGVGAVYIRDLRTSNIEPVIHGAGQEEGLRGGTLPAPIIESFHSAVQHFPAAYAVLKQKHYKACLLNEIRRLGVECAQNGESIDSLISLTLPATDVAALIRSESEEFALSTGSACSSKEIEVSHVLQAIGLSRDDGSRTLRISFHHQLEEGDILKLAETIKSFSE